MSNFEKIKLIVFGPKPKKTPKYAGVVRQWGWSSETIYRWRHSSYDNLEKQMASNLRWLIENNSIIIILHRLGLGLPKFWPGRVHLYFAWTERSDWPSMKRIRICPDQSLDTRKTKTKNPEVMGAKWASTSGQTKTKSKIYGQTATAAEDTI